MAIWCVAAQQKIAFVTIHMSKSQWSNCFSLHPTELELLVPGHLNTMPWGWPLLPPSIPCGCREKIAHQPLVPAAAPVVLPRAIGNPAAIIGAPVLQDPDNVEQVGLALPPFNQKRAHPRLAYPPLLRPNYSPLANHLALPPLSMTRRWCVHRLFLLSVSSTAHREEQSVLWVAFNSAPISEANYSVRRVLLSL